MFQVFDNDKPAQYPNCNVDSSWSNSVFTTFADACNYAKNWLGVYWDGKRLELNKSYDYSGCGDNLEIREI